MDNEPLKSVPIVKKKPQNIKITALFLIMLIVLIVIAIYISGLFGPQFLKFFMFMLLFLLPVLVTFRNVFLTFLPQFIKNNLSIVEEKSDGEKQYNPIKDINVETKRNDYLIMIVCLFCVISGLFFILSPQQKVPNKTSTLQQVNKPRNPSTVERLLRNPALAPAPPAPAPAPGPAPAQPAQPAPPAPGAPGAPGASAESIYLGSDTGTGTSSSSGASSQGGGAQTENTQTASISFSNLKYATFFVFLGLYISSQSL